MKHRQNGTMLGEQADGHVLDDRQAEKQRSRQYFSFDVSWQGLCFREPARVGGSCSDSNHCHDGGEDVCLFVGCLTSQQHASVSRGRICSDNFTCRHAEIEVADQTFYLARSQYTDTGPTSPSADPITPGA